MDRISALWRRDDPILRVRNREGFDVYIRPHAANRNAGYILVDLDMAAPSTIAAMRAEGHEPCV